MVLSGISRCLSSTFSRGELLSGSRLSQQFVAPPALPLPLPLHLPIREHRGEYGYGGERGGEGGGSPKGVQACPQETG